MFLILIEINTTSMFALTNAFTKKVETRFRHDYLLNNIKSVRITIFITALLYAIFGYLDKNIIPESVETAYLIRYGIVIPVSFLFFLLTYTRWFYRNFSFGQFLYALVVSGGILFIIALAKRGDYGFYSYDTGLILCIVGLNTIFHMMFRWAFISTLVIVLLYEAILIFHKGLIDHGLNHIDGAVFLNNNFFLLSVAVLAVYNSYYVEHKLRQEYLHVQQIKKDRKVVLEQNSQLNKLNQTKSRFFSILGHDLRNPLTAIVGLSELSKDDLKLDSVKRSEIHSEINSAALRLNKLLDSLLEWAKTQTGEVDFFPIMQPLQPIITETIQLLKPLAAKKDITLAMEVSPSIVVQIDSNMIASVIRNLVGNAIKFTQPGGTVTVSTGRKVGKVLLIVEDSGVGMDAQKAASLFNAGESVSSAGTDGEKGSGLGLLISSEFIQKHTGKISVQSTVGKGSSFIVELPEKQ